MTTPTIYLGWDSRTSIAYDVARASIVRHSSGPLRVIPLRLPHLSMLTRPIENRAGQLWCPVSNAPMSTEFAISRFCVPFLETSDWALFADCDVLCQSDIYDLFALADDRYAVMVVKHDHQRPNGALAPNVSGDPPPKMDGQIQTYYARKNWSSVVLWNCAHPANKRFTLEHLNTWPGRDLHAFKWLDNNEIGELPQHWNFLINVTPGEPETRGLWHYTLGGPWFEHWVPAPHDEAWLTASQQCHVACA